MIMHIEMNNQIDELFYLLQNIELAGFVKPAPFILRPFSGLFNPYPYGCSILCNHPADCEAREVLRRAKDSWVCFFNVLLKKKKFLHLDKQEIFKKLDTWKL